MLKDGRERLFGSGHINDTYLLTFHIAGLEEIDFVLARGELVDVFPKLLADGKIPLRVTHNDTKLSNVLIDNNTDKAICVIDLDTVMPGLSMNDFGDSIRFGASTAADGAGDCVVYHSLIKYKKV